MSDEEISNIIRKNNKEMRKDRPEIVNVDPFDYKSYNKSIEVNPFHYGTLLLHRKPILNKSCLKGRDAEKAPE